MSCGIYQILNTITGKCYVGSSVNISGRWSKHKQHLKGNGHHSIKLQRAWDKYGSSVWEWGILQECPEDALDCLEAFWQAKLNAYYSGYCSILLLLEGGKIKRSYSEETRKKMSLWQLGRKMSLEARKKMSNSAKLRKASEETRKKMSKAKKGIKKAPFSDDHRKKLSLSNSGKLRSKEFREKLSASNTGRKLSDETITKLKNRTRTEEQKTKMRKAWILRKAKKMMEK